MSKRSKILKGIKINIDGAVEDFQKLRELSDEDCLWVFRKLKTHLDSLQELLSGDTEFMERMTTIEKNHKAFANDEDDDLPF